MATKQSSKRRQRNSTEMYPLIVAYQKSDLSREAFCAAHELSVPILGYWQTKYRNAQELSMSGGPGGFVSLEIPFEEIPFEEIPSGEIPSGPSLGRVEMELDLGRGREMSSSLSIAKGIG